MIAARRRLRALQRLVPPGRGGVTVLAYHLVGAGSGGAVDLDAAVFRRHLDELGAGARVVPLREALAAAAPPADDRPRVALTFDDAYANFFERVWPELERLSLPATLFVPVGFVEGTHPPPIRGTGRLPPASWGELAAAAASGRLEIGSHSWTHRDLRGVAETDLERELAGARRRIEDRVGREVATFCYPRALWNRRVERQVAAVYRAAVVGGGRRWTPAQSPWRVQRVSLRRDGPTSLARLIAAPMWVEEWVGDRLRRARPRRRSER